MSGNDADVTRGEVDTAEVVLPLVKETLHVGITSEEELRMLLVEGLETSVGTDRRARRRCS